MLHALELAGTTGEYGRRLRAAVISFGATGRGAVTALNAHGVNDVDVLTHRDINAVASPIHSARMVHFEQDTDDPSRCHVLRGTGRIPLAAFLAEHDIVVNCVLQDTDAPLMFVTTERPGLVRARQPHRGRVLRRGHGLQLGAPHQLRRAHGHGRR